MADKFLFKPLGQGQVGTGKAVVLLGGDAGSGAKQVGVYGSDGKLIENLTNSGNGKFYGSKAGGAYGQNVYVQVTNSDGSTSKYNIPNSGNSYTGDVGNTDPGVNPKDSPGGPNYNSAYSGPGQFAPGQVGYGSYPGYLGGEFPGVVSSKYTPISGAKYNPVDPIAYATKNAGAITNLYKQNLGTASSSALTELNTELEGLQSFAPAATALKQSLTSADNVFNQSQRTSQVNSALPGVTGALAKQTSDAEAYAAGGVPSSINDKSLELGIRSNAADAASAGGFGATSSAAKKVSDLMSADERINLSKYGNSLLDTNVATRSNLELSPTEYSNAGSEISAAPSVSGSQLTASNLAQLNPLNIVSASTALGSTTQQEEFGANLNQQTQQFNASNTLQNNQFNASNANSFALQKFGYDVGYGNSVAAAGQTNIDTQTEINEQQQEMQFVMQYLQEAQNSGLIGSGAGLLGSILGGSGGITKGLGSLTGKGGGGGSSSDGSLFNIENATPDFNLGDPNEFGGGSGIESSISSSLGL